MLMFPLIKDTRKGLRPASVGSTYRADLAGKALYYKIEWQVVATIALLKLLTVLFIVGCNNRKLYYIEIGSKVIQVVHSSSPVHQLQTALKMST